MKKKSNKKKIELKTMSKVQEDKAKQRCKQTLDKIYQCGVLQERLRIMTMLKTLLSDGQHVSLASLILKIDEGTINDKNQNIPL